MRPSRTSRGRQRIGFRVRRSVAPQVVARLGDMTITIHEEPGQPTIAELTGQFS